MALLGTQGIFWGWYDEHYHPEKLAAAMGFQTGMLALLLLYAVATHVLRRRKANIEDLLRLALNAALFFAAAYTLLDPEYHVWMGSLTLGMAIVHTALAGSGRMLCVCGRPVTSDSNWKPASSTVRPVRRTRSK